MKNMRGLLPLVLLSLLLTLILSTNPFPFVDLQMASKDGVCVEIENVSALNSYGVEILRVMPEDDGDPDTNPFEVEVGFTYKGREGWVAIISSLGVLTESSHDLVYDRVFYMVSMKGMICWKDVFDPVSLIPGETVIFPTTGAKIGGLIYLGVNYGFPYPYPYLDKYLEFEVESVVDTNHRFQIRLERNPLRGPYTFFYGGYSYTLVPEGIRVNKLNLGDGNLSLRY